MFLHNFRPFLENWIFEGLSTGADLTKMVKIWTILNCAQKIFFVKIICSTHQRKCFSTILGHFWKIEFLKEYWQARTLHKWWKFELSSTENIFCQNYLFHSSEEVFLHSFRPFLENWIFEGILTGADLTKMVNYLKLCSENIFCQNFLFHSSKEVFLHNFRQFLENWIFEGILTGADLT